MVNQYDSTCLKSVRIGKNDFKFYQVSALNDERIDKLPYSIRILLESAIRNCDGLSVTEKDVQTILGWSENQKASKEIAFKPSRVILQDFTGVPAVVDLAAMRDAVSRLGGDASKVNPIIPADLVIDHSVQVDFSRSKAALQKNEEMEFQRNAERYKFLKWGMKAFKDFLIVPPASGIVHQVNLEYLARVVFSNADNLLYPDSVLGTDSHTTMINGLSVLGWGVGGIEAEAALLGQSVSMLLPQVIGFRLTGKLNSLVTSTDMVLTITEKLRQVGVVGKFVEFFGEGCANLSIADRATISNMSPEMGSTCCFFSPDKKTLEYLRQTGRNEEKLKQIEEYFKAQEMFRDFTDPTNEPEYTEIVELDLSTVEACLSGPKRPHDKVELKNMKQDFLTCLANKVGFKGFGIAEEKKNDVVKVNLDGEEFTLHHGSVVIAAITSCTNTSNPSVMIGAGIMAKNAVKAGLRVPKVIKTSMAPGSGVVTKYLEKAGLLSYLETLGFDVVGYGCTTCIGNSGPLNPVIDKAIEENDLVAAAVLSGNRNFEGRVHPNTRANYLASPMLVVAYALAGKVDFDFVKQPLGVNSSGENVYLTDIWPSKEEIEILERSSVSPEMFKTVYDSIQKGSKQWQCIDVADSMLYEWDSNSTYIKNPPYFQSMTKDLQPSSGVKNAHVLLNLGDSVTTDHISPAGNIARSSAAAKYLQARGIEAKDFNSYGSRRGNDAVMVRGTFANIRLQNKFLGRAAPKTIHLPTGDELSVFEAAERYQSEKRDLIILAGKEYGSGSSRDWAAKGPYLQGVKAVLAESFERIHRSNLVGMGIIPLEYLPSENAESLNLTGRELYSIELPERITPGQRIVVKLDDGRNFEVKLRFDTDVELKYFANGGILHYMVRKLACE